MSKIRTVANFNLLSFIDLVSKGFLADLRDSRRNSYCRCSDTVITLTWHPFAASKLCTFFMELHGDLLTILFIRLSSLGLVFLGRPGLFLSVKLSFNLKFLIPVFTALRLTQHFSLIFLSKYPSPCKVTIFDC